MIGTELHPKGTTEMGTCNSRMWPWQITFLTWYFHWLSFQIMVGFVCLFCPFNTFRSNKKNNTLQKYLFGKIKYNHRRNVGIIFISPWQGRKKTLFSIQNSQWEVRSQESLSFPCEEQWLKKEISDLPTTVKKGLLGSQKLNSQHVSLNLILSLLDCTSFSEQLLFLWIYIFNYSINIQLLSDSHTAEF